MDTTPPETTPPKPGPFWWSNLQRPKPERHPPLDLMNPHPCVGVLLCCCACIPTLMIAFAIMWHYGHKFAARELHAPPPLKYAKYKDGWLEVMLPDNLGHQNCEVFIIDGMPADDFQDISPADETIVIENGGVSVHVNSYRVLFKYSCELQRYGLPGKKDQTYTKIGMIGEPCVGFRHAFITNELDYQTLACITAGRASVLVIIDGKDAYVRPIEKRGAS